MLINGKLLMEHASVTINRDANAQPVTTVGRGFAGMSIGAPQLTATIDNAVPVAGIEQDMGGSSSRSKSSRSGFSVPAFA